MRYTNLPAQPATEGPDVVYTDGQFVAYANGTRIEAFDGSQDAWNAARAAAFAPVAPPSAELMSIMERIEAHLFPPSTVANPVTVETCPADDQTFVTYTAGSVALSLTQNADGSTDERATLAVHRDDLTRQEARDLYTLLSDAEAQRWMDIDAPAVTVKPYISDDEFDTALCGTQIGTDYVAGTGEGEVELHVPFDGFPGTKELFFAGGSIHLDAFLSALPALLTLVAHVKTLP